MNLEALKKYNKEVEEKAMEALESIKRREKERKTASRSDYQIGKIREEIKVLISKKYNLSIDDNILENLKLEEPPLHVENAHIAISMFFLGVLKLKKYPHDLAEEVTAMLMEESRPTWLRAARREGAYVNIELKEDVYGAVLNSVKELGDRYGELSDHKGEVAYFDFSHPNIAKPIGVGNMRSTIIGEALARIYEKNGYTVFRDNFLGDWGAQFGKLIYAYETWGDDKKIEADPLPELKRLYVRYHEEEENDPAIKEKAAAFLRQLENGDEKLLILWKQFREWSIEGYEKLYKRLGVKFDSYLGESFFVEAAEPVIEEALEKKISHIDKETGAVVVEGLKGWEAEKLGESVTEKELPSFLLRKGDGSTLYIARDLAAMKFRTEKFDPTAMRFVVGNEQTLNFRQLFSLAEKIEYVKDNNILKHVSFGLVLTDGKKMSTRKGTAVEFEEVLREATEKAKEIMKSRGDSLDESLLEEVSEIIGVGSVIYNDLRQSRHRDIEFNWEKMLSFEGGSAAYLQYTAVRIQSIIKNTQNPGEGEADENFTLTYKEPIEFTLAWKLAWFPLAIGLVPKLDTPNGIATYLEELAQLFNTFYGQVSIMKTEDHNLRRSRLLLIECVRRVLLNGLTLLNIRVPERM